MNQSPSYLWVSESFVDRSRDVCFGETEPYETFTDDPGKLFKSLQREYGRCTGRIFIDKEHNQAMPIGWIFLGREKYQDGNETYLREVWVTLHDGPPTRTIQYSYHELE